jgi:hypothetical protein
MDRFNQKPGKPAFRRMGEVHERIARKMGPGKEEEYSPVYTVLGSFPNAFPAKKYSSTHPVYFLSTENRKVLVGPKRKYTEKSKETIFAGELSETLEAIFQSSFQVGLDDFGPVFNTTSQLIEESRYLSEENIKEIAGPRCGLEKAVSFFQK